MHLVIFYDIPSDKIRRKVASACQDYGLDRTQFSAFVGDLTRGQQRELMTPPQAAHRRRRRRAAAHPRAPRRMGQARGVPPQRPRRPDQHLPQRHR